ncbi:hypothetical protein PIB30_043910 [Stylosanthes scabra]|uniref:C2H2-type domain-containing protein n=1 Tax=Stylosanthes scabra TaxID=79078 RepID=A0ABU6UEC7_9FABA|nr:hypothetical protein [Stylosanthes scabra]
MGVRCERVQRRRRLGGFEDGGGSTVVGRQVWWCVRPKVVLKLRAAARWWFGAWKCECDGSKAVVVDGCGGGRRKTVTDEVGGGGWFGYGNGVRSDEREREKMTADEEGSLERKLGSPSATRQEHFHAYICSACYTSLQSATSRDPHHLHTFSIHAWRVALHHQVLHTKSLTHFACLRRFYDV